jgi:uncharacterized protein (TIGR03083 family)
MMSTRQMAREERVEFAEFLEGLTPEQWDSPTLCDKWRIREVVIHTVSYDELNTAGLIGRFLKGRLSTDRINAVGVADYADRTPEQIVALIRANTEPRGLTGGFGGKIALTDGMIHQQDIRRPLGLPAPLTRNGCAPHWISPALPRPSAARGEPGEYALSPPTSTGRTATARRHAAAARPC